MTDNAGPGRPASVRLQPPRLIKYAAYSIIAQVVLTFVTSLLLLGYTSQLTSLLISANSKLKDTDKSKRPVATYLAGSSQVVKDLHSYREGVIQHAVLIGILFVLAAYAIWRGMGLARWLYIITAVLFPIFTGVAAVSSQGPALTNALSFVTGLVALLSVVLLLMPESVRYIAAVKAVRTPPLAEGQAPPPRPPGLRGLFAPAPPRPAPPGVDPPLSSSADPVLPGPHGGRHPPRFPAGRRGRQLERRDPPG